MIEKEECLHVAHCARPHGVNGEVIVRVEKGFTVESISFDFVLIELQGGLVPFFVEEIREKNPEEAIFKFENVTTQEQARRLSEASVYVQREWLNEDDGSSSSVTGSVIGYCAVDQTYGELGTITHIQEIAKNPLFIVDYKGRELMIPIVEQFIVLVDDVHKKVIFNLPEGLLDL